MILVILLSSTSLEDFRSHPDGILGGIFCKILRHISVYVVCFSFSLSCHSTLCTLDLFFLSWGESSEHMIGWGLSFPSQYAYFLLLVLVLEVPLQNFINKIFFADSKNKSLLVSLAIQLFVGTVFSLLGNILSTRLDRASFPSQ